MKKTIHGVRTQVWKDIHRDYKGIINGVKYVLAMDENGATISLPYSDAKKRNLV